MSLALELHRAHKERLARMVPKPPPKPIAAPTNVEADTPKGWTPKRYTDFRDLWFYMADEGFVQPPLVEDIKRAVCKYYGLTNVQLTSNRRHRTTTRPRQIGMYLAKHLTGRSYPEIARRFGRQDHSTAIAAIKRIEKLCRTDWLIAHDVAHLERQFSL